MEERRPDYPEILSKLENIKSEMNKVALSAKIIATKVEERNISALTWRTDVCRKFDKIFIWLENLPCKERDGRYKTIDKVLFYLKIAITFAITLIVGHLGWK